LRLLGLLLLLLLPAGPAARTARAADPDGRTAARLDDPFPLRGQYPLALPFLDLTPRSAFLLTDGEARLRVGLAYESTMTMSTDLDHFYRSGKGPADGRVTQPILTQVAAASPSGHAYYVDGETLRATLEGAVGIGTRCELGLTLPLVWHTTGFMDGPIERWHSFWGFPDGGRPEFARDQYVVGYDDRGRTVFLGDAPGGVRPGDLILSARVALLRSAGGATALAATAENKAPTGDAERFDGSGSWDEGIGLLAGWRLGRSSLHFGAQASWLGAWSLDDSPTIGHRVALFGGYAFAFTPRLAFIGQMLSGHGPFPSRDGGDLGDPSIETALGLRHAVAGNDAFEWALLENLTSRLNTTDFGLYMGWSHRLEPRSLSGKN
jgi:hypothetical protein